METSRPHLKRALWHFCPRYRQNFWDANIPAPLKLADQQVIEAYKFRFPGWKHPGPIETRMNRTDISPPLRSSRRGATGRGSELVYTVPYARILGTARAFLSRPCTTVHQL